MKSLDFRILPYDGMLEARPEKEGFYIIDDDSGDFRVNAYIDKMPYDVGEFSSILEAIEAANKHYNNLLLKEVK